MVDLIRQLRFVAFDFDGVFTDNSVYVSEDGSESVRCSRFDGFGLRRLRALNIEHVIISTETNPVVSKRAEKLGVECHPGCEDKATALTGILKARNLKLAETAFVGNDINDQACLEMAALPIVVCDSHPDVLPLGRYVTKTPGGFGAVREICDLIADAMTAQEPK